MTTKGLDALDAQMKEERSRAATAQQTLRLGDGDSAIIRFLTDGSDFVTGFFHSIREGVTRNNKPRFNLVYCNWENEDCEWCANLDDAPRRRLMHAYVWVYVVTKADGTEEEVNAPKLLATGPGKGSYITNYFMTFVRKYGTLTDRDYEWSRKGQKMEDTVYSLTPEDKGDAPRVVTKALATLPPLEDVVLGIASLSGSEPEEKKTATSRPRRSALLDRLKSVEEKEDSEDGGDDGPDIGNDL
jgi:hypothetical protein